MTRLNQRHAWILQGYKEWMHEINRPVWIKKRILKRSKSHCFLYKLAQLFERWSVSVKVCVILENFWEKDACVFKIYVDAESLD